MLVRPLVGKATQNWAESIDPVVLMLSKDFDVFFFFVFFFTVPGCSVTTVLLQVSHGKRPSVDMVPETRPQECNEMIGIMKQCWDQVDTKRPPFSGAEKTHLASYSQ